MKYMTAAIEFGDVWQFLTSTNRALLAYTRCLTWLSVPVDWAGLPSTTPRKHVLHLYKLLRVLSINVKAIIGSTSWHYMA